jgi:hypothetical protein
LEVLLDARQVDVPTWKGVFSSIPQPTHEQFFRWVDFLPQFPWDEPASSGLQGFEFLSRRWGILPSP